MLRAPFWIDRTEVTNAQYGSEGHFPATNRPRENLLWSEARDFCAERRRASANRSRMGIRGARARLFDYPWGNELIAKNLVFDQSTAKNGRRRQQTGWRVVGRCARYGGNVFEWVAAATSRYPYNASDGREDLNDTKSQRVYRGGNQAISTLRRARRCVFHLPQTDATGSAFDARTMLITDETLALWSGFCCAGRDFRRDASAGPPKKAG